VFPRFYLIAFSLFTLEIWDIPFEIGKERR
jgi:hypothetical protein